MGKQDKREKKRKKAEADAERIVAEAKAKVKSKPPKSPTIPADVPDAWIKERADAATDEQFALGVQCRRLREEGEPWWAIAKAMELQGWGESATTGKKGASRARGVYKAAFGAFPRTFTTGRSPAEKNERVRELQKTKKAERRLQAKQGKSVIPASMPDEEVAEMLKGRRIRWWVQSDIVPEGMEQEACVHPKAPLYIIGEGEERVIEFREHHRRAPVDVRWVPGPQRTIRLRSIFAVR